MAKACGRRHNLDGGKTLQGLLPNTPQLHFSQTIAHTTVNTEPEGRMIAHAGSIDQETICIGDHQFVSIGGFDIAINLGVDPRKSDQARTHAYTRARAHTDTHTHVHT